MRVVSVNVGQPRTITLKGREVQTSIYKQPVTGPCRVSEMGVQGDARISPRSCELEDHAVYIYPYEHYEYWQHRLGVAALALGQFGENLTVEGVSEHTVRVGDQLRCGDVLLQVVQPRLPCAKLNVRMGRRFAGTFLRSGRLGFYCRVLRPGQVQTGDAVEMVATNPAHPLMEELIRISQLEYWDVDGLRRLSRAPLPVWWLESIADKLERAQSADGWLGFRQLEIMERRERDTGCELVLRCLRQKSLPPASPGQFVTLALRIGEHETYVRHQYPVSTEPNGWYRVALASNHELTRALRQLAPGDTVAANAPRSSAVSQPD